MGGPIIEDKLHFFITADYHTIEAPWSVEDFDRAGSTLTQAEQNIGITRNSMDEIVDILEGPDFGIPVPPSGRQYGTLNNTRNTSSILAKLDYQINDRNMASIRYNYHTFHNPNKRKADGLLSTQYEENSFDHSVLLSLRSNLSPTMTNDLRLSFADVHRPNELIYPRAPVGRVRVDSEWEDGTSRSRWIFWGNQYWIPEIITETNYQLVNNLRFQSDNIRYTVGVDFLYNQITDIPDSDVRSFVFWADFQGGLATYDSILDQILHLNPSIHVGLRDYVRNGYHENQWQQFFHFGNPLFSSIPGIFIQGNHDDEGY